MGEKRKRMKRTIAIVLLCAAPVIATAQDKKTAGASAPQAMTIPKDAVPRPGGLSYLWTDKQGNKWVYVKTPFGVTRSPAVDDSTAGKKSAITIKAIDKGDLVMFERPGPFGMMKWEKKKSDLTVEERQILEAQSAKTDDSRKTDDTQTAKSAQKNH